MKEYSSPFSVNNNNYLITGASSGIGRSLSILLSRSGANLILIDIDEAGLLETKSECKDTDKIVALDLRRSSEIKVVLQKAVIGFGKLHGFVHLAGKPYISPLKSISEKKCEEIFLLNTYAVLELAKYFINRNIYAGERGSIVLISSIYALVGSAANIGYAMSKSALHGITKSLAIELAPKKIRVNCIAPGFVKTPMMRGKESIFTEEHSLVLKQLHPLGIGEPQDIANAILFLLSDASKWITGSILSVDGGFTAQ